MMLDPRSLYEYSLSLNDSLEDQDLQKRLELFQTFSKLYERHRDLLNEILALEHAGTKAPEQLALFNYIQGVVLDQQVFLVTNLLNRQSQALVQPQKTWLIGRDGGQVSLAVRDKRLSRRHAAIQYQHNDFYLVDLGSTNGTFVNGERIRHQTPLRDGDRIRLGSMTLSFFICKTGQALPPVSTQTLSDLTHAGMATAADSGSETTELNQSANLAAAAEIPPFVFEETLRFIRHQTGHN